MLGIVADLHILAPGSKDEAAGHDCEKVKERGRAVGKKNLLLSSGVVLLRVLMVFTVSS